MIEIVDQHKYLGRTIATEDRTAHETTKIKARWLVFRIYKEIYVNKDITII